LKDKFAHLLCTRPASTPLIYVTKTSRQHQLRY